MQRKELYERKRSRGTTCATRKVPQKGLYLKRSESLQKMVGGYISFTYPFKEDVGIVLNDEGKLLGLPFNRALRDENGNPYDIINGDFLVVGLTDDDISSLSPELMDKFERLFHKPEVVTKVGGYLMISQIESEN